MRLAEWLDWGPDELVLSMWTVSDSPLSLEGREPSSTSTPDEVRRYDMIQMVEGEFLSGRLCCEYDLLFNDEPPDLEDVIKAWARAALDSGAEVVWFGAEGSFHFENILTKAVALNIYAVGTAEGIWLGVSADDVSGTDDSEWAEKLDSIRRRHHL